MNLMIVFAAIGRHRKMYAVAEEMGMTKSAVSHALNRLRDIFDDPLFVRELGGVKPTPRAATLLPKVAAILQLSNEALMLEDSFDPVCDQRELKIGAVEYVEAVIGPELIRICNEEAPQMRLNFSPMTRIGMIDAVASYKVDIGLGSFAGETAGLYVEPLHRDEYVVVRRRLAAGEVREPITRDEYLAQRHIAICYENQPQRVIEGVMSMIGVSRRTIALVPHYITAFTAVSQSDCLLTVPRLLATTMARRFDLEINPFPFPHESQAISAVSSKLAKHDPALDWLQTKCREAIRNIVSDTLGQGASGRSAALGE